MRNWIYVGIDQTGAVDRNGKPRPLPACFIRKSTVSFFYLKHLSKAELIKQINPSQNEEIIVCVDCVIGLPKPLRISWRKALRRIGSYQGYGLKVAQKYFRELVHGQVLRREIEIACNANSVFKEKPFQKNIQTGSFRIWKDISLDENNFYAPAVETLANLNQIKIYEGYPSLSWRLLFGATNRQPLTAYKYMKHEFPQILFNNTHQSAVDRDPNLADALLLALTMKKYLKTALSLKPCDEGWILGF